MTSHTSWSLFEPAVIINTSITLFILCLYLNAVFTNPSPPRILYCKQRMRLPPPPPPPHTHTHTHTHIYTQAIGRMRRIIICYIKVIYVQALTEIQANCSSYSNLVTYLCVPTHKAMLLLVTVCMCLLIVGQSLFLLGECNRNCLAAIYILLYISFDAINVYSQSIDKQN